MTPLSPMQRRVVIELALHGGTNAEIARSLGMNQSTVRTHISQALLKLGCHTRAEIVAEVWRSGQVVAWPPPTTTDGATARVAIWSVSA